MTYFSGVDRRNQSAGELLKLDIDFSLSREGLKVATVLFDSSTDEVRSNSVFTRVFGKLMEWRAKYWVREYVTKNALYLPGSDDFLKNINSSEGVKRDDFMNLMMNAKISRSPLFLRPTENTRGLHANYAIRNPEENLLGFFVKMIDPSLRKESVKTFFNFIDGKYSTITKNEIDLALDFLGKFREWSENNEDNEIFKKIKGSVNMFHSFISKKINDFEMNDPALNLKNIRNRNAVEKNIKEAFDILSDKKNQLDWVFSPLSLPNKMRSSGLEFWKYIKYQSCALNFTNIDNLKKWVETDYSEFINRPSLHCRYLAPSLTVAVNQLKIDIKNFESESYKKELTCNSL